MATSDFLKRISELSPKRLALLAMELQTKLDAVERQKNDPIAVIGMGCRFPGGANTPDEYWELLLNGVDAITDVPTSRWDADALYDPDPDAPGKVATRWGGFIENVDLFDPQFFGIAPREAVSMDPQQRMLLEVSWEALERAGYAPDKLAGSAIGVFIGICNGDYYHLITESGDENIDVYLATGSAHSVASGRISYVMGLQGPSISVDTACSSSLVAIHLAVRSIRAGECDLALAGGVNLVLALGTTKALSRAGMMASDGRCKAFDAAADGFVRSEGCGMIVLKRLSAAIADGDNILAVICGSAVNQDGRSNGLTAPNGPSQEAVIREALKDARVEPGEVGYIETHGTGTSLGDPIEVQALGAVIGQAHSADDPLMIGSAKTNFGHLESAAGVAGLMKLVLMLQHGEIPPHLHLNQLNPYIPWDDFPVIVPTERRAWPGVNERRIGGVSSFGFSGTNAHLILESAPPLTIGKLSKVERPLHVLTVSAKGDAALQALAARLEQYLAENPDLALADLSYSANIGRAQFSHRLAISAADAAQARETLAAFLNNHSGKVENEKFVSGQARETRRPEIAFLFTGQGAQYVQMGRQLYETQPTFRKAIDKCDELSRPYLQYPLLSVLYPDDEKTGLAPSNGEIETPSIHDIANAQPAQFAIEYALAELWRSWGIEPSVVMGHSVGEYAAAVVAGVFSLEDGLKLVIERGRLMATTAPGEMAAVFADRERVAAALVPYKGKVSIASLNGPEITVISGEKAAIQGVIDDLKPQRIRARRLEVSIAAHSPMMEPILNEYMKTANTVTYSPPQIEFVSCVTGKPIKGTEIASADYWRRHMRETVQFFPAMQTLQQEGYGLFVEIGPAPDLLGMGQRCLPDGYGVWLPSLRPGTEDWRQMLKSLSALYVQGVNVDWAGFDHDYTRRRLPLPTYPFQRSRYWFKDAPKPVVRQARTDGVHPLLGQRLRSPSIQDIIFETQLSATWPPFLDHHRIYGIVILPSPAYLEMALGAAGDSFGRGAYSVRDFTIHEALVLPEDGERTIQIVLTPMVGGECTFRVLSPNGDDWKLHASGKIVVGAEESVNERAQGLAPLQELFSSDEEISGEVYYEQIRNLGLEFGSDFRGITRLWRRDGEALADVRLPDSLVGEAGLYGIHPAFLDACFHLLGAPLPQDDLETAYLLIGIERFQLFRAPGKQLWNHTVLTQMANREVFTGTVRLYNEVGELVAEVEGLQLKRAGREALMRAVQRRPDDWLYEVKWEPKPNARPLSAVDAPGFLAAPPQIAAHVNLLAGSLNERHDLKSYYQLSGELDQISTAYIVQALWQLGMEFRPGDHIPADTAAGYLGVVEQHYRLLNRALEILEQDGILQLNGDPPQWEVLRVPDNVGTEAWMVDLKERYPAYGAHLGLLERCGVQLAQVLRGKADPLHLLFPGGSLAELESIYQDSPFAQVYNTLVQEAVQAALVNLPPERSIRVLEIGAGTGATSAYVLPTLPQDGGRSEYVFTDLSPLFLERAKEKFDGYPSVRFQLLDIENDPATQGFAPHTFDIILAANVLHATRDLRRTLARVQLLLAPGGLLVLLEGTQAERWVDLTFGMTEGWWKFADSDLRPAYPLMASEQWLDLLADTGFIDATSVADAAQAVILAQNPLVDPHPPPPSPLHGEGEKDKHYIPVDWLILSDSLGIGTALVEALQARGEICLCAWPGDDYLAFDEGYVVNPTRPEDFRQLLNEANPARGIINLWALDANLPIEEQGQAWQAGGVLHLTQALIEAPQMPALWLVTQNAQPAQGDAESLAIAQAPLWGWGRVYALEHPEIWGGLIDVDAQAAPEANAALILSEILQPDGEDQIAWRAGQRYVARLAHTALPQRAQQRAQGLAPLQSDGVYLITGGLGGLGLKIARWMVDNGAKHIVLTGRRGLPPRESWDTPDERYGQQIAAVQEIEALGTAVTVAALDVSDMAGMSDLFALFGDALPPLRGVIHAAAALDFWSLKDMPLAGALNMLRPKVAGTWVLHQLTQNLNLDFFVMFSSTTALWGVTNMAHYAAANTFMDAFAHYRRALGLPALSINWGTWEEMRIASAQEQQAVAQFGLKKMASDQTLAILGDLMAGTDKPQVAVASVDWAALKPAYEARRERPFLALVGVRQSVQSVAKANEDRRPALLEELEEAGLDERREVIENHVRAQVARVLGMDAGQSLDAQQGLFEMGMDSLMSVELKSRLEASVGQALPSTLTFNYPTIADLAEYFDTKVLAPSPALTETPLPPTEVEESPALALDDDLSEDDLEALLLKKLKGLK